MKPSRASVLLPPLILCAMANAACAEHVRAFEARAFGASGITVQVKTRPLPPAEAQAVAACLAHLRACQLPDGAFAQVSPGDNPAAPVWIAPYFAHFAALALLSGHAHAPNPEDLIRAGRWLGWCATHQSAEGYWTDFEGTRSSVADTGTVDAWDSSAALFLLVAERYRRAGGEDKPETLTAARRAFACLARLTDADGLTWAKPDYRVKFLMDNIEVLAGWRAAAAHFDASGSPAEAKQAKSHADRLAAELPGFWQPEKSRYAHARLASGAFAEGEEAKAYPHGLAQLYGIAFVAPHEAAWKKASKEFQPETGPAAACISAWWLTAASRVGESEARVWRERVVAETAAFNPARTYLHHPALSALALLDGAGWLCK